MIHVPNTTCGARTLENCYVNALVLEMSSSHDTRDACPNDCYTFISVRHDVGLLALDDAVVEGCLNTEGMCRKLTYPCTCAQTANSVVYIWKLRYIGIHFVGSGTSELTRHVQSAMVGKDGIMLLPQEHRADGS